jgi:hypothetical protein
MPSGHDPFQGHALYPIYVTAALSPGHRLGRRALLEITKLADEPLLLLGREFGLRQWFEAACDVAHVRPRVLMESVARIRSSRWQGKAMGSRWFLRTCSLSTRRFALCHWCIVEHPSEDGQ